MACGGGVDGDVQGTSVGGRRLQKANFAGGERACLPCEDDSERLNVSWRMSGCRTTTDAQASGRDTAERSVCAEERGDILKEYDAATRNMTAVDFNSCSSSLLVLTIWTDYGAENAVLEPMQRRSTMSKVESTLQEQAR